MFRTYSSAEYTYILVHRQFSSVWHSLIFFTLSHLCGVAFGFDYLVFLMLSFAQRQDVFIQCRLRLLICFLRKKNINTYETYKHIHAQKVFTNADNAWIFSYLPLSCCVFHFYLFAVFFSLFSSFGRVSLFDVNFFVFAFLSLLVELANSLARFTWNISYSYWNTLPEYGMASRFDYGFSDFHKNHATRTHNKYTISIWIVNDMVRWWANDSTKCTNQMRIKCS